MLVTKRHFLVALLSTSPALSRGSSPFGKVAERSLTPGCGLAQKLTVAQTAGPFYKPGAPLKRDLGPDAAGGTPITLAGFVLDTHCQAVPNAMVEVWHADREGSYDNTGFALRGHQFTDEAGRWGFTTIVTQHYSVRTAHYHFRVETADGRSLMTSPPYPVTSKLELGGFAAVDLTSF